VCPPYYELCDSTLPYIPGECPHACYLNGECVNGECHCFLGFSGEYCNQRKSAHLLLLLDCPVGDLNCIEGLSFSVAAAWFLHILQLCSLHFFSVQWVVLNFSIEHPVKDWKQSLIQSKNDWHPNSFWVLIGILLYVYRCLSQCMQWSWHLHSQWSV
jgi:hypothetical protein